MKNVKRILAVLLLFVLMVGIVACGKGDEEAEKKKPTATVSEEETTTLAEEETTEQEVTANQDKTEETTKKKKNNKKNKQDKTKVEGSTKKGESVTNKVTQKDDKKNQKKTTKKNQKKTTKKKKNNKKNQKKTTKKRGKGNKTQVKTTPTLPTTNPQFSSTVATAIPRTQDANGNPTEAFVASCAGFELKYLNPWGNPAIGSPIYESSAYVEQMVEAEFNCTITEDGFYEGYGAALTASLAAGKPQAHIYRFQDTSFAGFLDKNYFCDLTAGMKKAGVDFKDPWYDLECREFFNINGKQVAWSLGSGDPYKIYYNKNMVSKAKLTDPMTLAKSGKWTWDALISYSQKLGTANVDGLVVMEGSATILLKGMVASYGKSTTKVAKGAEPTTNIEDTTVKKCLTSLYEWNSKGYVKLGGADWTAAKESFGKGKAAMIYGAGDILSAMSKSDFNSEIGVVPFPKPSPAQTKYYSVVKAQFPYFIPSTYKNEAAKILFLNNERQRQSYRFWMRDFVANNMDNFKGENLDMLTDINYCKGNYAVRNDWGTLCETGTPSTGTIADAVAQGKQTAQGAIDEYADSLKQAYEDVWKGKKITGNI